ncbi:MAG: hypothetical protein ACI8RH_001432 [Flavobacteriales bacterium]|jgi:hypothetical protein
MGTYPVFAALGSVMLLNTQKSQAGFLPPNPGFQNGIIRSSKKNNSIFKKKVELRYLEYEGLLLFFLKLNSSKVL